MPYVYSTATCATSYVEYKPSTNANGHNQIARKVIVHGGHGVATRHLTTPKGVVTEVSQDDLDFLLRNRSFQKHMKHGFVSYDSSKVDPAKRAESMAEKDNSAPLTPKDFQKGENDSDDLRVYKGIPTTKPL